MGREPEELQFLGIFGIFNEAYNIIVSWGRIFSQVTLAFIVPLSFICLAQIELCDLLFPEAETMYHQQDDGLFSLFLRRLTSEWAGFWIFMVMYHIFLLVLSVPSNSAFVYTIACVLPTVWKRLMITFLWAFVITFLCYFFTAQMVFLPVGIVLLSLSETSTLQTFDIFYYIVIIIYVIEYVYISVIWHLASVVSVFEESYGYKALLKSKALLKGKMWIASVIFIMLQISFMIILLAFDNVVAHGRIGVIGIIVCLGIFCVLLLSILIHFALAIQTVLYFVCKSCHKENIDKSCLAEHLEAYSVGDSEPPIRDKNIQLDQQHEV
ncbi:hypothetical protein MKW98_032305 [Papaver atlanticum]|uniref:Uncharacterized protein n=1 Tax=Papaver atlanticum TaxID=357466 RepID=A0AAD4SEU5_9MAGN|nr:hypothetical protein MKW98_032305 [Papaver atlanticum]